MEERRLKTARVRWRMGQPLLPEHFYCQEESLRAESHLRLAQLPAPQWGVAQLDWELSIEGRVRIHKMVLVREDGGVIDIPGNCDAPPALEVGDEGQSELPLYLHFDSGSRFTKESPHGDSDNVERTVLQVQLSAHASSDPDSEPFKLAELVKSAEDEWDLSEAYIPPCTRVAQMPFFRQPLRRLRGVVETLHQTLVKEIRDAFLSAEGIVSARACLRGVFDCQAVLADLTGDMDLHPSELWKQLTQLYLDLCIYRGVDPTVHLVPYRQRQLGECFNRLLDALEAQVAVRKTETPHAVFSTEGNMVVCKLPPEARHAKQIYWLLQKERVGDSLQLNQVKLAGPDRLGTVHQLALRGIPFRRILNPPFHHNFTSEVEFYALERGEEWDHALREGKVSFYARNELTEVRGFMYWRSD